MCIRDSSLHHQAIRKLAPTLQVMALSEDGIPQSLRAMHTMKSTRTHVFHAEHVKLLVR